MTKNIDYSFFKKALKNLEMQYSNMKTLEDYPVLMKEAVAESVIQRFEICSDLMWKILRKYLNLELGLSEVPSAPKSVFRMAFENKLLPSDIGLWLNYIDVRNNTSHDYSGEKAQMAIDFMSNFISDAIKLYEVMSKEVWK